MISVGNKMLIPKIVASGEVTFTEDDTWTVPLGVTSVTIECWGAGGKGGRSTKYNYPPYYPIYYGSGAAGGGYSKSVVSVSSGDNLVITVAPLNTTESVDGGSSKVEIDGTIEVLATGGGCGFTFSNVNTPGGTNDNITDGIGDTKYNGGSGGQSYYGGPGGGGAGSTGDGGDGPAWDGGDNGGTGTDDYGGDGGGRQTITPRVGKAGSNYGGGGGGAYCISLGVTRLGGNGAQGFVKITY